MKNFRIDVGKIGNSAILSPIGDVDAYTSDLLKEAIVLHANAGRDTVINFEKTGYIDSTGLAALIRGLKHSSDNNRRISIVAPTKAISRVFEITGLVKAFNFFPTVALATMPS